MIRSGRMSNFMQSSNSPSSSSSSNNKDDDERRNIDIVQHDSISSLSQCCHYTSNSSMGSSAATHQFSIDLIDDIIQDDDHHHHEGGQYQQSRVHYGGRSKSSSSEHSDCSIINTAANDNDDCIIKSSQSQGSDISSSAVHRREHAIHTMERPCNPEPPPISSSFSSSSSSSVRSKQPQQLQQHNSLPTSSYSSSSASSSASLIQALLKKRRNKHLNATTTNKVMGRRNNNNNRPPNKIYLPSNINCCSATHHHPKQHQQQQHLQQKDKGRGDDDNCTLIIEQYTKRHFTLQSDIKVLIKKNQSIQTSINDITTNKLVSLRSDMIRTLAMCGGNAKDPDFVEVVKQLEGWNVTRKKLKDELQVQSEELDRLCCCMELYHPSIIQNEQEEEVSSSSLSKQLEGQWFTLTSPTYMNCLGHNSENNPMYTLGRMSFEMFSPSDLILSIDAVFNPIMDVVVGNNDKEKDDEIMNMMTVPKTLQEEVKQQLLLKGDDYENNKNKKCGLRTYHIVTAFTIEPYSPSFGPTSPNLIVKQPIRGIMTTYGYALPDPSHDDGSRLSVWFSGGKIECGEGKDSMKFQVWKDLFGSSKNTTTAGTTSNQHPRSRQRKRRTFTQGMMVYAAKLLMGAQGYNDDMDEETGTMKYKFVTPMGGHGKSYVDILHLDDCNRVMRGHAGTLYVFARMGK